MTYLCPSLLYLLLFSVSNHYTLPRLEPIRLVLGHCHFFYTANDFHLTLPGTLAMAKRTVGEAGTDVSGLYIQEPHFAKLVNVFVVILAVTVSVALFCTSPISTYVINRLIFGYSPSILYGEELA